MEKGVFEEKEQKVNMFKSTTKNYKMNFIFFN